MSKREFAFVDLKFLRLTGEIGRIFYIEITNFTPTLRPKTTFYSYINPEKDISEKVEKKLGITNSFLKKMPIFESVAKDIKSYLKNRIIVMNGEVKRDFSVLLDELFLADEELEYKEVDVIDLQEVESMLYPSDIESMLGRYWGKGYFKARPLTFKMGKIFEEQMKYLGENTMTMDVSEFKKKDYAYYDFSEDQDGDYVLNFGAHKGKKIKELSNRYLEGIENNIRNSALREVVAKELDNRYAEGILK